MAEIRNLECAVSYQNTRNFTPVSDIRALDFCITLLIWGRQPLRKAGMQENLRKGGREDVVGGRKRPPTIFGQCVACQMFLVSCIP
jgi:hypothetical protein